MVDAVNKGLVSSTPIRVPSAQDAAALRANKLLAQNILNATPASASAARGKTLNAVQIAKDASPPPSNLPRGSIIDELV